MNVNRDILLFVALAIAWGTAFSAIEIGLEALPPILFAALRFDVAAAVFAAAIAVRRIEWRPKTSADWIAIAVGGGLLVGAHFALLFLGQSYVSSAIAAIVMSLIPIVTPPLALAVLPRTRVRAPAVVGLLVGLAGIVVLAVPGGSLDGHAIGIALLLASALVFAIGSVLLERTRGTLPIVSLQAWAMAVGAGVLHALSFVHPGEHATSISTALTPATFGALAYLGIVSTAGGFFLYFVLLERVGATELSLINYVTPVVAVLVGWALLGESITLTTIAGFALIVAGFSLCKIETLWRTLGPMVGRGPTRPLEKPNGVVVAGNVYQVRANTREDAPGTGEPAARGQCAD
ncbi:DMT family transporter [Natrarchaeobius chitinivorans]|uniref:EamA/RhaT family transporter n=1 Tax=Natrarchaeobius chitinivorans TaxID=1679083 RepID=A0A3N6P0T4_NATCH|nr:EamA family transporter [Natrarchaeobius chitinivorans]RQG91059.1 EamA/RhaT family transporter [Natrarchaeobius chitinivorans]